jgi:hypothetical protein
MNVLFHIVEVLLETGGAPNILVSVRAPGPRPQVDRRARNVPALISDLWEL